MRSGAGKVFWFVLCVLLLGQISARSDDLRMQRGQMHDVVNNVSKEIEKDYYDPQLRGLDWKALTAQAHQQIDNAKSVGDMFTAVFTLTNKLNDSHVLFLPPSYVSRPIFGFEAKPYGNEVRIFEVKKNGPAAAAGLRVGDRILRFNNFNAERNTFDTMMYFFYLIRPAGQLEIIYQRGNDQPQTVRFTPKFKTGTKDVDPNSELDLWDLLHEDEREVYFHQRFADGVGFIAVPSFSMVESRPEPHKLENPKAVIVDLRGNGGGRIDTLLEFAGHFSAEAGKLADEVQRKKTEPMKIYPQQPNFAKLPVVILVDAETGSAAEMFARFMQLRGNTVVVGDRTAGRVRVSRTFLGQVGNVLYRTQVSVARVAFSDGIELEKQGVVPDVPCALTEHDLVSAQDTCLMLAEAIAHDKLGLGTTLPEEIQAQVRGLAAGMVKARDEEYQRPID